MPVTSVLPELVAVYDALIVGRQRGGPSKVGDYPATSPDLVAAAFPTKQLAAQLSELTGPAGGNVGQVRAVRVQYEHACALARAEALRRSTKVRVGCFATKRRLNCEKGLRLPLEIAQTLLRAST